MAGTPSRGGRGALSTGAGVVGGLLLFDALSGGFYDAAGYDQGFDQGDTGDYGDAGGDFGGDLGDF